MCVISKGDGGCTESESWADDESADDEDWGEMKRTVFRTCCKRRMQVKSSVLRTVQTCTPRSFVCGAVKQLGGSGLFLSTSQDENIPKDSSSSIPARGFLDQSLSMVDANRSRACISSEMADQASSGRLSARTDRACVYTADRVAICTNKRFCDISLMSRVNCESVCKLVKVGISFAVLRRIQRY